ncbi:MAG: hypothetical protein Q8R97_02675 [Brevundimonas sp.]|nr:hypothetical protein [Brevundimonas sp.]
MTTSSDLLAAFKVWFAETALAVPMKIVVEDLGSIEIEITGTRILEVYVDGRGEISVVVLANRMPVDIIQQWKVAPAVTPEGVVCCLCEPGSRILYPTIEDLWRNRLFEPFENWVSEELRPATRIGIGETGGASWTVLLRDDDDRGYRDATPLWLAKGRPGMPGSPGG